MISVCIATYNGERYVTKQLLSILAQLSEYDEVIISDDRSTDNTVAVIKEIKDRRISVTVNEYRSGPVGNFEKALKRAKGEYIFLADQDDIWLPGKVNSVLPLLHNYDLVLTDCIVINENNELIMPSFFEFRKSQPGFWRNLYRNSYMGCCMAFKRTILTYTLPFPDEVHMHDWWIGLLVEVNGSVYFHNQPLINYVRHGSNASPTGESGYGALRRLRNRYYLLTNLLWRSISL
ncbi:glycosyltransferase family 2 protein [Spirosoma luteum]|uniref:glycosyltransferase family 2 protein n=1 Tax=Spirosoma luteum TaxID=431553 RepID=UPI00037F7044|nr:glycosyltransferase family 2 protein [Spirosoma luteum]